MKIYFEKFYFLLKNYLLGLKLILIQGYSINYQYFRQAQKITIKEKKFKFWL